MSQGKPFEIERPLQGICLLEINTPVKEEKKNETKDAPANLDCVMVM